MELKAEEHSGFNMNFMRTQEPPSKKLKSPEEIIKSLGKSSSLTIKKLKIPPKFHQNEVHATDSHFFTIDPLRLPSQSQRHLPRELPHIISMQNSKEIRAKIKRDRNKTSKIPKTQSVPPCTPQLLPFQKAYEFDCSLCGEIFEKKADLKIHNRNEHPEEFLSELICLPSITSFLIIINFSKNHV